MTLHTLRKLLTWTRCVLVSFIWLCWLPWSVRQVWRGLFWLADGSWVENERAIKHATEALANATSAAVARSTETLGVMITNLPDPESE